MAGFSLSLDSQYELTRDTQAGISEVKEDLFNLCTSNNLDNKIFMKKYNKEFLSKLKPIFENIRDNDSFRQCTRSLSCGYEAEAKAAKLEDQILEYYLEPISEEDIQCFMINLNKPYIENIQSLDEVIDNNTRENLWLTREEENIFASIYHTYWDAYLNILKKTWQETANQQRKIKENKDKNNNGGIGNLSPQDIEKLAESCKSVFD